MPRTLTSDSSAALGGPAWLATRRASAAACAADTPPPSPSDEVWRYSRIAELELDGFVAPEEPDDESLPAALEAVLDAVPAAAAQVVLRNGHLVRAELSAEAAAAGVSVRRFAELDEDRAPSAATDDLFALLGEAHAPDPVLVEVPAGVVLAAPIVAVEWVDQPTAAVFTRLCVRVGADAEARLLQWQGSGDVAALVSPRTEVALDRAARFGHLVVQDLGSRVWQIGESAADVDAEATLTAAHVGLGGDYARCRTDCRLVGRGATGTLLALYFGEGAQTLDYRTFQDHIAPDTTSELLYKGAVGDESRSVYSGLIRVGKDARGTNAFQTNRNIKLSDGAWAESVPNLEIENNDVRCSHASTVGPIDDEQAFYLESRGVPPTVAQRLIVAGFFRDVLSRLPVPEVAGAVERLLDERLSRTEMAASATEEDQ